MDVVSQHRRAALAVMGLAPILLIIDASATDAASLPPTPGVACEIAFERLPQAIRLTAIAHAERSLTADYRFAVTKNSSSGRSQTMQSGTFTTSPSGSDILTTVMLDTLARGHYTARLVIEWDQGSATCSSP